MRRRRFPIVIVGWLCAFGASGACAARQAGSPRAACALPDHEARWIQAAVEGWERASRDLLRLDPEPFPWTLMLGRSCVWHLAPDPHVVERSEKSSVTIVMAGRNLDVRVQRHDGRLRLPSGNDLGISGVAFGSVYERKDNTTAPFFVLALPEVWRLNPKAAADPRLDSMMLGVFSHEVVHTRQLLNVHRRVEELGRRVALPEHVDDDIVQKRFAKEPGYAEAYDEEAGLLYRAAVATDPAERRRLARQALALVDARHARYFSGDNAFYADLEGLFLNMEGIAVWVAYRLSEVDPRFDIGIKDPAADRSRNTWSQDEGLALMLVVDAMVPDWREHMLGPELTSPFALLRRVAAKTP